MANIIMLGPQTSGKGTQAAKLSKKLGIPVLVSGDILREKKSVNGEEGNLIASFIDKGKFVPDELINKIIKEELERNGKFKNGVILDGYPRNLEQAEEMEKFLKIDKVMFLDVPDSVVSERMTDRRVCEKCRKVYNLKSKPSKQEGVCDDCGGGLIQRHDDTEDAIKIRLDIYHQKTKPLVEHYKEQKKLIHIDGTKGIDEVHEGIMEHITRNM